MISVSISHVNGDASDYEEDDAFYNRFLALQSSGVEGKKLIIALLTDDWGAPPRGMRISGTLENGSVIAEVYIPYK